MHSGNRHRNRDASTKGAHSAKQNIPATWEVSAANFMVGKLQAMASTIAASRKSAARPDS